MRRNIILGLAALPLLLCGACALLIALWLFWPYESRILTEQHSFELRPVMEEYFAVIQQAQATLDTRQLDRVMTKEYASSIRLQISPEYGIHHYSTVEIRNFYVEGYTPDRARVFVSTYYSNNYQIDEFEKRTAYPDRYYAIFYVLIKVNGTWKVDRAESLR